MASMSMEKDDLIQQPGGRSRDLGIEEESRYLDIFSNEESNSGEHGNTSVGEFGLTVTGEGGIGGLLGESERIEGSYRGKSSSVSIEGSREIRGGRVNLGRSKGSSRSEEGGEYGEFHFDLVSVVFN